MGIEIKKDDSQLKGKEIIVNGKTYNISSTLDENRFKKNNQKQEHKSLKTNKKIKNKSIGFILTFVYILFLSLFIALIFKLIF